MIDDNWSAFLFKKTFFYNFWKTDIINSTKFTVDWSEGEYKRGTETFLPMFAASVPTTHAPSWKRCWLCVHGHLSLILLRSPLHPPLQMTDSSETEEMTNGWRNLYRNLGAFRSIKGKTITLFKLGGRFTNFMDVKQRCEQKRHIMFNILWGWADAFVSTISLILLYSSDASLLSNRVLEALKSGPFQEHPSATISLKGC